MDTSNRITEFLKTDTTMSPDMFYKVLERGRRGNPNSKKGQPDRRIIASKTIERGGRKYIRTLHATKGWRENRLFF